MRWKKRSLAAVGVTLVAAFAMSKLIGTTPSVEAPGPPAGRPGDMEATSMPEAPEPATDRPDAAGSEAASPPGSEPFVQQPAPVRLAVERFAAEIGQPPESIELLGVEPVTWPDASLGCPQPGKMYAQVLTEGYRVELEAEGELAEYHTDRDQQVIRCRGGGDAGSFAPTE